MVVLFERNFACNGLHAADGIVKVHAVATLGTQLFYSQKNKKIQLF